MVELFDATTLADKVASRLRKDILEGRLKPGTRLQQSKIGQEFGVSTTPVREALTQLQGEGLVVSDRHRGAVVFTPSLEDFREIFTIRELLEAHAVSRAVAALDSESVDALQRRVDAMSDVTDRDEWVRLNNEFHLTLYRAAGLPRLLSIITMLRDASSAYLHMFASARGNYPGGSAQHDHEVILDACRRKDVELAVETTQKHLRDAVVGVVAQQGDGQHASLYEAMQERSPSSFGRAKQDSHGLE